MRRAFVLLALGAVATACSGGGGDRLSKEEYARRANDLCRRYERETRPLRRPETMVALARAAERSLPPLDRVIAGVRLLRAPEPEGVLARRWLSQLELVRLDVVRLRARARANDAAGLRELAAVAQRRLDRANHLAADLGAGICASA